MAWPRPRASLHPELDLKACVPSWTEKELTAESVADPNSSVGWCFPNAVCVLEELFPRFEG